MTDNSPPKGPQDAKTCRELIEMMPQGLQAKEAEPSFSSRWASRRTSSST